MKKAPNILILAALAVSILAGCSAKEEKDHSEAEQPKFDLTAEVATVSNLEDLGPDVTVSSVMDFSQIVQSFADTAGLPYGKALRSLPESMTDTENATYRIVSISLPVKDSYHPFLDFYCKTREDGDIWEIVSGELIQLRNSDISKSFGGQIGMWLRENNQIEFFINGDFYNDGATTFDFEESENFIGIKYKIDDEAILDHSTYYYDHCTVSLDD